MLFGIGFFGGILIALTGWLIGGFVHNPTVGVVSTVLLAVPLGLWLIELNTGE